MYRRFAFSLLLIALSALSCFADEPTAPRSAANIAFRDSVVSLLKDEWVIPSVNEDGDILFTKEGCDFLVAIYDDTAPFYVQISYYLSLEGIDNQVGLLNVLHHMNLLYRCVKCSVNEEGDLLISVESYDNTTQVFKDNFKTYTDYIIQVGMMLGEFINRNSSQK